MTRYSSQSHDKDSKLLVLEGEWHFGWVLNGLAMQDVWIVPRRSSSTSTHSAPISEDEFLEYGTTIRFFVPGEGEYRAVWAGPKQGKSYVFRAKAMEGRLEMVTREGEREMKWCLTGIGEESFEWREWIREEGGEWWVREEFSCRRMK